MKIHTKMVREDDYICTAQDHNTTNATSNDLNNSKKCQFTLKLFYIRHKQGKPPQNLYKLAWIKVNVQNPY